MYSINNIDDKDILKKEARGLRGIIDLGEVISVGSDYIVTEKGTLDKERYYLPRNLVEQFDGATVFFKITSREEADQYKKD